MSKLMVLPFIAPARLNPGEAVAGLGVVDQDALRFVSLLTGGSQATFQTFDDSPAKQRHLARILHGPIEKHATRLRHLNQQGAGVFLMINEGDGCGRQASAVRAVRALFVDLDGAPLTPVMAAPIPPHLVVETSPGRWHAYWLVDGVPLESFSHLQVQLAKMFGADVSVKDVCRVMRVPGFLHQKSAPCRSRLVSVRDEPKVDLGRFIDAFGLTPVIAVGERNTTLFKRAAGLKQAGIPKHAALDRVCKMNRTATSTPLDASEVASIVDNAYQYAAHGYSQLPHAIVDTMEFKELSGTAAKLFIFALRRHFPGRTFSLTHNEFRDLREFKNRKRFRAAINELIEAGLLEMVRDFISGTEGERRACALYRIADRVQNVPKHKQA